MADSNMIVIVLLAIVSVILILSIVHISGKVDEICNVVREILEEQRKQNKK